MPLIDDVKTEAAAIRATLAAWEATYGGTLPQEAVDHHNALWSAISKLAGHLGTTPDALGIQPLDGEPKLPPHP